MRIGSFHVVAKIIRELKSHMILINSSALISGKLICKKNPLQDLLSSLNAVISTNLLGLQGLQQTPAKSFLL